jgi:hypothetical protein
MTDSSANTSTLPWTNQVPHQLVLIYNCNLTGYVKVPHSNCPFLSCQDNIPEFYHCVTNRIGTLLWQNCKIQCLNLKQVQYEQEIFAWQLFRLIWYKYAECCNEHIDFFSLYSYNTENNMFSNYRAKHQKWIISHSFYILTVLSS